MKISAKRNPARVFRGKASGFGKKLKIFSQKKKVTNDVLTIGIDEVGRGPIAGPVAVGAFVFLDHKVRQTFKNAKESKQLSTEKREYWFRMILDAKKKRLVDFAVSFQSGSDIDKKGIVKCIDHCLRKSLGLVVVGNNVDVNHVKVLLDGGLSAPEVFSKQRTIVKGDEKILEIALASICAKVLRDSYMVKIARKYPAYDFHAHKGYGTASHYEAIRKKGICVLHRKTFLKSMLEREGNLH